MLFLDDDLEIIIQASDFKILPSLSQSDASSAAINFFKFNAIEWTHLHSRRRHAF